MSTLKLDYLPIDPFAGISLDEDEYTELKWKLLAKLGIERRDDVSPLVAWRDHVADESEIPRAALDPEQGGCLDLMFATQAVRDFVFFLA